MPWKCTPSSLTHICIIGTYAYAIIWRIYALLVIKGLKKSNTKRQCCFLVFFERTSQIRVSIQAWSIQSFSEVQWQCHSSLLLITGNMLFLSLNITNDLCSQHIKNIGVSSMLIMRWSGNLWLSLRALTCCMNRSNFLSKSAGNFCWIDVVWRRYSEWYFKNVCNNTSNAWNCGFWGWISANAFL